MLSRLLMLMGKGHVYATLNPSDKDTSLTLSDGNLKLTASATPTASKVRSTIGKSTGKWYWEYVEGVSVTGPLAGIATGDAPLNTFVGQDSTSWGVYGGTGSKYTNGSASGYAGAGFAVGDVIGVALDMDNGTVFFSVNGSWQGSGDPVAGTNYAFNGLTGAIYAAGGDSGSISTTITFNFGATAFTSPAPSGYNSGLYV